MDPQSHFVARHSTGDTHFIVSTAWGPTYTEISITDFRELWTGRVAQSELRAMKRSLGDISTDRFIEHARTCLTQPPDASHFLGFEKGAGNTLMLKLKVSEEADIEVLLGEIRLTAQPRSDVGDFLFDLIGGLQEAHMVEKAGRESAESENTSLRRTIDRAEADLKAHVDMHRHAMEDAYVCFRELINTKKAKIRQLKAELEAKPKIEVKEEDLPRKRIKIDLEADEMTRETISLDGGEIDEDEEESPPPAVYVNDFDPIGAAARANETKPKPKPEPTNRKPPVSRPSAQPKQPPKPSGLMSSLLSDDEEDTPHVAPLLLTKKAQPATTKSVPQPSLSRMGTAAKPSRGFGSRSNRKQDSFGSAEDLLNNME